MTFQTRRVVAAGLALLLAGPAAAQDAGEDWDLVQRHDAISASIAFDSGLAVAVRCDDGSLETYIAGLAPPRERDNQRTVAYAFGDRPMRDSTWQNREDGHALFADLPAPLARRFRSGGDLQLRIAAHGDAPARRYVVSLPPSPAAIDRVLTTCGRPTVDPRDVLRANESSADPSSLDGPGPGWARQPRPSYPDRAVEAGISGMAVLSCMVEDDGRTKDCQVEVERPAGADFGREALRAARDARLKPRPSGGGLVTFTIRFSIPGR